MKDNLQQVNKLYQKLSNFILDAEGELAISLEKFSAEKLSKQSTSSGSYDPQMVVDLFITEGKIHNQTPIDLFIANQPDLSTSEQQLLQSWSRSFVGLFVIETIDPDGLTLKNWLTDKNYHLKIKNSQEQQQLTRSKLGEILLTRISPLNQEDWIFSAPLILMGKLGKPKLAIAIGNFKRNYPNYLYGDAPELLEQAWLSVAWYHQQFVDYFGNHELNMSGRELADKLPAFQQKMTENRLESAGIDKSKSLQNLVDESGVSPEEIQATAETMGVDKKTVSQIMESSVTSQMVTPKVDLPRHILNAPQVTVISHPHWGQVFLTDYIQFKQLLESTTWEKTPETEKLVRNYLSNPEVNTHLWLDFSEQYPTQLEHILKYVLNRPNFSLSSNLDHLLREFHKPEQPQLPEIASVPIHLHQLFEEALLEINRKNKSKSPGKSRPKKGFQS